MQREVVAKEAKREQHLQRRRQEAASELSLHTKKASEEFQECLCHQIRVLRGLHSKNPQRRRVSICNGLLLYLLWHQARPPKAVLSPFQDNHIMFHSPISSHHDSHSSMSAHLTEKSQDVHSLIPVLIVDDIDVVLDLLSTIPSRFMFGSRFEEVQYLLCDGFDIVI